MSEVDIALSQAPFNYVGMITLFSAFVFSNDPLRLNISNSLIAI